jgi:hypothetical protein
LTAGLANQIIYKNSVNNLSGSANLQFNATGLSINTGLPGATYGLELGNTTSAVNLSSLGLGGDLILNRYSQSIGAVNEGLYFDTTNSAIRLRNVAGSSFYVQKFNGTTHSNVAIFNENLIDVSSPFKTKYSIDVTNVIGNTGASKTIDVRNGVFVTATLDANCTFTFTTGAETSTTVAFTLLLRNDAVAGRSIVWPASVRWPGGTVPPRTLTASRADLYTFFSTDNGATWYGMLCFYNYT